MEVELIIQNGSTIYMPSVENGITWSTDRQGVPGELNFTVVKDSALLITEGNPVRLSVDGVPIFYGFIFTKKMNKGDTITITAYDQLRYFKNKDTYVYSNLKAGELLTMIAEDFNLQIGSIEDTEYIIASRVEENTTLFDMMQNALDLTLQNKNEMYVMFDDVGKINLTNIANLVVPILIDEETGENFDYTSSIDNETYNKVKLTYDNEETGYRDVYVAQHSENINSWGMLQYFDTLQDGENGQVKVEALLSLYNKKTRNLSISNAFGDSRVHAGCMVVVQLDLGDVKISNYMVVEKCKHTFNENEHFMDLTLRGGEFIA